MIDPNLLTDGSNLCLSGGAVGADLQWGMVAGSVGHHVIHWSFQGAKTQAPPSEIVVLDDEQLSEANEKCESAGKYLHRPFPLKSKYTTNLLRRNWYQVAWSNACYAISSFDKDGFVKGGTAWATTMFIQRFNNEPCPCFVFDQNEGYWAEWTGKWDRIKTPPVPSGIWAGIGTRDLNVIGKLAIRVLLNYRSNNIQQES